MAIIDVNGRPRSIRTPEERLAALRENFENLSDAEKAAFMAIAREIEAGDFDAYKQLVNAEYERLPVDPRTFLLDDYYLGRVGSNMWPKLQDDFVDLFTNGYSEAILGGCIDQDALVYGADGSLSTLRERLGTDPWVTSVTDVGSVHSKSSGVVDSGVRQVVKLTLDNGSSVKLTPDHKVRVWRDGYMWVEAGKLLKDDMVVVPRMWSPETRRTISIEEAMLLAYFVGGDSVTEVRARFCDDNPKTSEEVVTLLRSLGFEGERCERGSAWEVHILKTKTPGFWEWARHHGLGARARGVVVPDAVCTSPNEVVAAFLNRLWACEGRVYAPESAKLPPRFTLEMASERFVRQVQAMLLRFGIRGRISEIVQDGRSGNTRWHLQVSGLDQLHAFLESVGPILGQEDACNRVAAYVARTKDNPDVDVLPVTWGWLNDRMVEAGIQRPADSKWWMLATNRGCRVSRSLLARWLGDYQGTDLGEELALLFDESIGFERVRSVDDVLVAIPTGDVTDAGEHRRYVANGISVSNSIGWGKSFFASCGLAYVIYQMSCLKDPQRVYGLAAGSSIVVALISMTREVARRVPLNELYLKLEQSPYFKEVFPFKYASTMYEIRFGKRITVVAGSTASSVIGGNVFAAFIDEASFMGDTKSVDRSGRVVAQDKGAQMHASIMRRMKSRFQKVGKLPGVLFTVSSKERPVAFVEKRIEEVRQNGDPSVFVREYSTWEVKPRDHFSEKTFKIAVGNDRVRSVLDPTPEQIAWYLDQGLRVIDVPEDYRQEFESDLEGALRDVAGVATEAVSPFIHRIEKIADAVRPELPSPVSTDEWVAGTMLEFNWNAVCDGFVRRLPGGYEEQGWRPKRHPSAPRYVHIDPALSGDSAGICIAHIASWTEVVRKDQFGQEYVELAPIIETDLLLGVRPPPGDEIFLGDLRAIVYQFQEHGFPILYCSLDRYQSADTMQQFRQRGIESELTSVDRTPEPYEMTKTALYEDRIVLQSNEKLLKELQQLQRIPKGAGYKIDHPKIGSKDIADALAGCCYNLLTKLPGRPMAPTMGGREGGASDDDVSWVTGGKVLAPSSGVTTVGGRGGRGIVGPSRTKEGGGAGAPPLPFIKG